MTHDQDELSAAIANGDLDLVQRLLAGGASPLAGALRAAHRHGRAAPIFQTVKRAAKEAIDRAGSAYHGLATLVLGRRYSLRTDRGVEDLRGVVGETQKLDVLLVQSDLKTTVRELANLVSAPRREADVGNRPVADAHRLVFVYRLRGLAWTIVPFVFEARAPWNVEHVHELAAMGSGIAPIARTLARATASRVIHVEYAAQTIYSEHGGIETRPEDGGDALRELGAFVPPMRASTDGYHVRIELMGIDPADVERVDVVVLQEHGDPDVHRGAGTAPARVAPPSLSMPSAPPMVTPVVEASPASNDAPTLREPPPMVAPRPPPGGPPPMVAPSAPPPLVQDEPSPARPPGASAPPPMVRQPPPMVPRIEDANDDEK